MKAERTLRVPTVVVGASLWTRPILLLAMALLPTIALAAAGSARAQSARSVRPAGMRTDAASTKVGRMSSVQLDTVDYPPWDGGTVGDDVCWDPICGGRLWVDIDYLLWWTRASDAPALVTTSLPGRLRRRAACSV